MLSIIIPIYNVEKYIERCARSLMKQTLSDIEYIFVNDASTDRSMEVLYSVIDKYPDKKYIIISHPLNKGLAAARNTGLKASHGNYIMHCDSDDWIETDMCKNMYEYAVATQADIVVSDIYKETYKQTLRIKQTTPSNGLEALRYLLRGEIQGYNCSKIIKSDLYKEHHLAYVEGINMWEDLIMMVRLFFYAKSIKYIPKAYYHYVQYNPNSYTKRLTLQSLNNLIDGVKLIEDFFTKENVLDDYKQDLCYLKLTVKLNLLLNSYDEQQKLWNQLYPESNSLIATYKAMSWYWRIALWFASNNELCIFNFMKRLAKSINERIR